MRISIIKPSETLAIRHQMLRIGKPLSTCIYPGDSAKETFHLGAFEQGKMASIISFYMEKHPEIGDKSAYRFRGMATLPEFQSRGFAKELLRYGFKMVKNRKVIWVWCNARTSALGLYLKMGMKPIGNEFELPDIGPHLLMVKQL